MQLIKITRSFIHQIHLPNRENTDFFCSRTEECLKKDAAKVSKALHLFCKNEVIKAVKAYKKELTKLEIELSLIIDKFNKGNGCLITRIEFKYIKRETCTPNEIDGVECPSV